MFGETANLVANLTLKGNFANQLKTSQKALGSFDASLSRTESRAFRAGQQIGTGIRNAAKIAAVGVGLLFANIGAGVRSLAKLEVVVRQTNAVIKSTHGAAGQTGASIRALANSFESLNATMDDTAIQSGANVLLTFTNIRKNAFVPALRAALDLSQAMGQDLQSSIVQVGKALNDPAVGLTALRRIGVAFSADQVKRIKQLEKEGKLYAAQKIILGELAREFGGSFAAAGQSATAKYAKFLDVIDDLQRTLAAGFLPVVSRVSDILSKRLADPRIQTAVADLGAKVAGLFNERNLAAAGDAFEGVFRILRNSAPLIQQVAGGLAKIVKGAVDAFRTLPPEIQKIAIAGFAVNKLTGGLVTNIVGGIAGKLFTRGATPANPLFVKDVGGLGGVGGAAAGAAGVGTGTAIAAIAAAVATTVISTIPFANLNNKLSGQGLNQAEIEAIKYYRSSAAAQQEAAKHLGHIPSRADFDRGIAKIAQAQQDRGLDSGPLHKASGALSDLTRVAKAAALSLQSLKLRGNLAQIIAGITQRSARAHGGTPLSAERIDRTFQRDLIHEAKMIEKRTGTASQKIDALRRLQHLALSHKDWGVASKIAQAIRRKQLSVKVNTNITARTFINGREVSSNLARYSTVSRYGAVPT